MTDYREISALGKEPDKARALAVYLLKVPDIEWSEWELDFIEDMVARQEGLSMRQAEKLVELRDETLWYEKVEGFALKGLVDTCFLYQDELSEHDQEFITQLKAAGATKLRRRPALRLMRCARTVRAIEPHHGRTLEIPKVEQVA